MSQLHRRSLPIAAIAACAVTMILTAPSASAKTITLHFFDKGLSLSIVGPSGKPVPLGPTSPPPVAGDRINATDDYYVGNHKHHAKHATASGHFECTFVDAVGNARCSAQIAIGGSMLLATDVTLNVGQGPPPEVPINGGTGTYKRAHGVLLIKPLSVTSNDADVTLKFTS